MQIFDPSFAEGRVSPWQNRPSVPPCFFAVADRLFFGDVALCVRSRSPTRSSNSTATR
jgi:hypothetical protein